MIAVIRSALFLAWFALVSVVLNVGCLPLLAAPRQGVVFMGRVWARLVLWGLKWIAGVGLEIRGHKPQPGQAVFIAAKHLSMWETVAFMDLHPDPAIIIKRELLWVPFYGWYAKHAGMIGIDRQGRAKALRQMLNEARLALAERGHSRQRVVGSVPHRAGDLGDRLAHIHLADGSGANRDEHLVPGTGNQPVAQVLTHLQQRGFDGQIVVEISTRRSDDAEADLRDSLAFARMHS